MKKKTFTTLKLNKKSVSNFKVYELKGGCPSDGCTREIECQISGPGAYSCW